MAQPKPEEKTTLDQVLKLVDQLSAEEQEQLVEKMKLEWLRKEIQKGIDQADRGEMIDGDVVFAELKQRYQDKGKQK
jgi:hypothetical protein